MLPLLYLSTSLFNLSASVWAQSRLQFGLLLCVTGWRGHFPVSGNTVNVPILLSVAGQNILPYAILKFWNLTYVDKRVFRMALAIV